MQSSVLPRPTPPFPLPTLHVPWGRESGLVITGRAQQGHQLALSLAGMVVPLSEAPLCDPVDQRLSGENS